MYPLDWLDLILRWVHLIAGISWIGSSFYFVWLDRQLTPPEQPRQDVEGELWMVHSGGFYRVERKRVGPGRMPKTLHWFKWEAGITWISGMFLLGVIYYVTKGLYLVDPAVSDIGPGAATALGLGLLVVSWVLYDVLWRSPLGRSDALAGSISLIVAAGITYGICQVMSGRAAYIHVGAMLGTLMTANVWMRILPAQRQMIDATREGREPDITLGEQAKRRSHHNSYMTLPVLFIMLSNHFPATYGSRLNWLVLGLLAVAGAGARHLMIARSRERVWVMVPVVGSLIALFFLTAAPSAPKGARSASGSHGPTPSFAEVKAVITARCVACHSQSPRDNTFGAAPGGVSFDEDRTIKALAERIKVRAVLTETMPLGNKTGMTAEERALLGRWIERGAPVE